MVQCSSQLQSRPANITSSESVPPHVAQGYRACIKRGASREAFRTMSGPAEGPTRRRKWVRRSLWVLGFLTVLGIAIAMYSNLLGGLEVGAFRLSPRRGVTQSTAQQPERPDDGAAQREDALISADVNLAGSDALQEKGHGESEAEAGEASGVVDKADEGSFPSSPSGLTLEEHGWVAWPPPNPPPDSSAPTTAADDGNAADDTTSLQPGSSLAELEVALKAPTHQAVGEVSEVIISTAPASSPTLDEHGWVAWPPPNPPTPASDARVDAWSSEGKEHLRSSADEYKREDGEESVKEDPTDERTGEEEAPTSAQISPSDDGSYPSSPSGLTLAKHGWVAWPPPNPPPLKA